MKNAGYNRPFTPARIAEVIRAQLLIRYLLAPICQQDWGGPPIGRWEFFVEVRPHRYYDGSRSV